MPAVRTALRKRPVIFTGPSIWNKIAVEHHQLSSVASFKFHYLKNYSTILNINSAAQVLITENRLFFCTLLYIVFLYLLTTILQYYSVSFFSQFVL